VATVAATAALALFFVAEAREVSAPDDSRLAHEAVEQRFHEYSVIEPGTRPELSQAASEYTRIPVRPPRFSTGDVSLRGWQRSRLHGRQAAVFIYQVGRHQVNVHTLDARDLDLRSRDRRVVDGREIWVSQPLGFSTVSYKDQDGIGYVFSSDMASDELVKLVLDSDLLFMVSDRLRGQ
jgi:hypothetical protein